MRAYGLVVKVRTHNPRVWDSIPTFSNVISESESESE